jgi:type IV secretory pathway TrbL component
MRTTISLIIAVTLIGAPAAIAQTTGTSNSGAGVQGMPGNKSGPATKNSGDQSSGTTQSTGTQDTSKIQGMPGNKSGPPAEKPSRNQ